MVLFALYQVNKLLLLLNTDMLQISAVSCRNDDYFNKYVIPTKHILAKASDKTALRNYGGVLMKMANQYQYCQSEKRSCFSSTGWMIENHAYLLHIIQNLTQNIWFSISLIVI